MRVVMGVLRGDIAMLTVTVSPKFQVVIPKDIREALAIRPRAKLQVFRVGNGSS
jgi:AbrB family looped-hinge helix DNA binding protein